MPEAALPFDVVPVVFIGIRRQPFDRPCHEVGDHGVKWHALAGDQDAGLAGGAEGGFQPAPLHFGIHRHARVHLADRAVGADRKAALARAFLAVGDRVGDGRDAHVMQRRPGAGRGGFQHLFVAQKVVQPAGDVEAKLHGFGQHGDPGIRDDTAPVGNADDQRARTCVPCLLQGHIPCADIGLAPFHAVLSDHVFGPPILDTLRDFRGEIVRRIAEKQQVGCTNHGCLHSHSEEPIRSSQDVRPN